MDTSAETKEWNGVDFLTITGLAGVASYVIAYALLQLKLLDGNGVTYSALNVLAAALVLVSLTKDFNLASAVTQVLWIGIGCAGIIGRLYSGRQVRARAERRVPRQRSVGGAALTTEHAWPSSVAAPGRRRSLGLRPDLPPSNPRPSTGLRADKVSDAARGISAVSSDAA